MTRILTIIALLFATPAWADDFSMRILLVCSFCFDSLTAVQ